MINEHTAFVADSENQLEEGMRVPQSTEILESSFGLYKTLEKQHSKGGFTGLIHWVNIGITIAASPQHTGDGQGSLRPCFG